MSKRMKLKDQHKIRKKVHAHEKKMKKAIKKNPQLKKRMNRENLIVPNTWPMKQEMIKVMKKKEEEAKQAQIIDAAQESEEEIFDKEDSNSDEEEEQNIQEEFIPQRKKVVPKKELFKHYLNVIKNSDIILQVLDARDPLGTRSLEFESLIKEMDGNKTIILIINKIDQIPIDNLKKWLAYFRKQLPTIAFQSAVPQNEELGLGHKTLSKALHNFVKNSNRTEDNVTVGVVGFPNVGKSSLISTITSHLSTTVNEEENIVLDNTNITILAKPATLIASPYSKKVKGVIRNATNLKFVLEPLAPIKVILELHSKSQILQQYQIPDYKDQIQFLKNLLEKENGKKKQTTQQIINRGRIFYEEWLHGKLPYYTEPPKESPEDRSSEWSELFQSAKLESVEKSEVFRQLSLNVDLMNKKLMFASVISPLRVFLHPAWKVINRVEDDPLEDIKEDIARKKQKQGIKKQARKAQNPDGPSSKKQKTKPKADDTYNFDTDFVIKEDQ